MSALIPPNTDDALISRTSAWAVGAFIAILAIALCLAFARRLWVGLLKDHALHVLVGLLTGVFVLLLYAASTIGIEWAFSTSDLLLKLAFVLSGLLSACDYYFAARDR
jgi:hypothetical protein